MAATGGEEEEKNPSCQGNRQGNVYNWGPVGDDGRWKDWDEKGENLPLCWKMQFLRQPRWQRMQVSGHSHGHAHTNNHTHGHTEEQRHMVHGQTEVQGTRNMATRRAGLVGQCSWLHDSLQAVKPPWAMPGFWDLLLQKSLDWVSSAFERVVIHQQCLQMFRNIFLRN